MHGKVSRIAVVLLALVVVMLISCMPPVYNFVRNNPVDPSAGNYQGYYTVGSADEVVPEKPGDGEEVVWLKFVVSELSGGGVYDIQISGKNDFSGTLLFEKADCNTNILTITKTDSCSITSGNTYYWRVRAHKPGGDWGKWSFAVSFNTSGGISAAAISPENGGSTIDTTPLLDWGDADGAAGYQVEIADTEAGIDTAVIIDTSKSEYQVSSALSEGTKYWRVRPVNAKGVAGSWSDVWSFPVNLGIPENPVPSNGGSITDTTPLLDWDDVADASVYHIQLSSGSGFSTVVEEDAALTDSQYQVQTVLADWQSYYWRVRIKNADGVWGSWSSVWNFNVGEGFENGTLPSGWTGSWVIDTDANSGDYSLRSVTISDGESSTVEVTVDVPGDTNITFYRKVSSERGYDFLKFYIDGTQPANSSWSGNVLWSQVTFPIIAGSHTFRWIYSKDGSVSSGSDCAWIDDIIIE